MVFNKKNIFILILAISLLLNIGFYPASGIENAESNELIVRFNDKASESFFKMSSTHKNIGSKVKKEFKNVKGMNLIELQKGMTLEEGIKYYKNNPNVLYAEPNYIYKVAESKNSERIQTDYSAVSYLDYDYRYLWGLENTGQIIEGVSGIVGADISAVDAWSKEFGEEGSIIAVLDTGIDYTHPDLIDNMWVSEEGYFGIDFVNDDNYPLDDEGHGTHVAGTIAGYNRSFDGPVGVMKEASLMALKVLNTEGYGSTSDIIEAIEYANNNGADVINISIAGRYYSYALEDAIKNSDALVVAAAGNSGTNNDYKSMYPASYELPNLLAVAATNNRDELADFSNYGVELVDVAAPGDYIFSTALGGGYVFMEGTSMSTPYVSGIAGLIKSYKDSLTSTELANIIKESVDKNTSLANKIETGGRVDAYNALSLIDDYFVTEELTGVIIELGEYKVVVDILDYENAFKQGAGNQFYDYLSTASGMNIFGVVAGDKYIGITDFALAYSIYGEEALLNTQALAQNETDSYLTLIGFDNEGNPIFENQ